MENKEVDKIAQKLFEKHILEIEKNYPGCDWEDISQYRKCDFEEEALSIYRAKKLKKKSAK